MTRAVRHRGPDAQGELQREIAGRIVYLGHRRLSIIDLSAAGNQPMTTADGQVAMVFNGEVYNFEELRARYLATERFASRTDTEVVLRLYERMGVGCLDELNGDFAMAILDARSGKLFLVRDRAGTKPLYYASSGGRLLFGSEIKAVLAGGHRAELDESGLQRFFVFKYTPGVDTLFRGVMRVPPGHCLEHDIATGREVVRRYWTPGFHERSPLGYGAAQERLHELVADSTRMRLVADVPVGTFLSGGIDSSIIASILRGNDRITHYCASQSAADSRSEGTTSDHDYASRLARDWGLRFQSVPIGSGNVTREQIGISAWYADDLIADAAQIPSYLITKGAAATSKVFLSGMGADELFLGYAGHRLAVLWRYLERLPGKKVLLHRLAHLQQGRGRFQAFRRYLYRLGRYAEYPSYRYGIFSIVGDFENSIGIVAGDRQALTGLLSGYFAEGSDPFEDFKRFEYENFLQKNLSYVDAMSMANSVEVRVPYLDHRVMQFAWSLPREYKLGGFGRAKKILVDAFAGEIPDYVVRRRKAGFGMPIRAMFRDADTVRRLLDVQALREVAPFNCDHIERVIEAHAGGREDNSAIIFALLSFQEWHRVHFGGR